MASVPTPTACSAGPRVRARPPPGRGHCPGELSTTASTPSTRSSGRRRRRPGCRSRWRGLLDVMADFRALPDRGVTIHTDRLIYAVTLRGGSLRDRVDQPTDLARFVVKGARRPAASAVHRRRARVSGRARRPSPRTIRATSLVSRRACTGRPAAGPALRRLRGGPRPAGSRPADPYLRWLPGRRPVAPAGRWHRLRRATGRRADPGARRGDRTARTAARPARRG